MKRKDKKEENLRLTDHQKQEILAEAALHRAPDEIREIYKNLGEVLFSAKALGVACRYRGLECVKALVEGGAVFFDIKYIRKHPDERRPDGMIYSLALLDYEPLLDDRIEFYKYDDVKKRIPLTERLKIYEYLCEDAEQTGFEKAGFLEEVLYTGHEFLPYLTDDIVDQMAKIALTGDIDKFVVMRFADDDPSFDPRWDDFHYFLEDVPDDCVVSILSRVISKLGGKKIQCARKMFIENIIKHLENPETRGLILENFEFSEDNKTEITEHFISSDDIMEFFELAEKNGWFDDEKFLKGTIEFSVKEKNPELTAWLLDCKHRRFDISGSNKKSKRKKIDPDGEL